LPRRAKAFAGPWSKWKPAERQLLLLKLADLVEQHIEELAALDTFDMGAPISRTRNNRQRAVGMLRCRATAWPRSAVRSSE
jgi:aldehyde dehydrogenase (NAD+)